MSLSTRLLAVLVLLLTVTPLSAFFSQLTKKASKAVGKVDPAILGEAVAIYQKKYKPSKARAKQSPLVKLGMPTRDIDGTVLLKNKKPNPDGKMGPRFSERSDAEISANFAELARVYGPEAALQMVKDDPLILAFNSKNFEPALQEFAKIFGLEESKAMVQRNPGLLALTPSGVGGADKADNSAMQFSYIVAATRPAGPFLLYGLLALLSEPIFEGLSGIPVKQILLSKLGL